jgi:multicomponent Na+:H+ antiporter subunit D
VLALCSALLGLVAFAEVDLTQIGRQVAMLEGAS